MSQKMICLATFVVLLGLASSASADTYVWNSTSSDAWSTAGNWTPSGPPGAADVARVNNTQSATVWPVIKNAESYTVDRVSIGYQGYGKVTIESGGYLKGIGEFLVGHGPASATFKGELIMTGGTAETDASAFKIANEADGYLLMTAGTINVPNGYFGLGRNGNTGQLPSTGDADLHGGLITCQNLHIHWGYEWSGHESEAAQGTLDIEEGQLETYGVQIYTGSTTSLTGTDATAKIDDWIQDGYITAYGVAYGEPGFGTTYNVNVSLNEGTGLITITATGEEENSYATLVNPGNGDTVEVSGLVLSWTPGARTQAVGHDVYFGTAFADVNDANTSSPEYRIRQDTNTYNAAANETLDWDTTYYWRIDEVNDNDPNIWKGSVWSFTTEVGPPPWGLSRGQWILLQYGLQIGAQSPRFTSGGRLDMTRWAESNFTTVQLNPIGDCYRLGSPPGVMFGGSSNPNPASPGSILPDNPDNPNNARAYLPNFALYKYRDEQDITDSGERNDAKTIFTGARLLYPQTLFYLSQPGADYTSSQIRSYMQYVLPDMLSWAYYPFRGVAYPAFGTARITRHYQYMQKYREIGLEGLDGTWDEPIPVGHWLQAWVNSSHTASESEIRLDQFSGWAFGEKIESAWRYNNTSDPLITILFSDDKDASPTQAFDDFAETNRQSRNLGPTLVRLLTTDIRFIRGQHGSGTNNAVPSGVDTWNSSADPYITSISATNPGSKNNGLRGDVLVGYFKPLLERFDGPAYSDQMYFMIVNGLFDPSGTAAQTQQQIHIEFDFGGPGISSLQRLSRDTGEVETVVLTHDTGYQYYLDLVLDGGTGDLFKFNTAAPFIVGKTGDFDFDNDVDTVDLKIFTDYWLGDTCNWPSRCEHTDFDQSTTVDAVDFAIFAENYWLAE